MKKILLSIALLTIPFLSLGRPVLETKGVSDFISQMVKEYHFNRKELTKWFSNVSIQQTIISNISTPYEAKPWYVYRKVFLSKKRIEGGVYYWKKHQKLLWKAEKCYGVPRSLIVAIIGVESYYGKVKYPYRALDALSTLAFAYPLRAKFFKRELIAFFLYCREQKKDPLMVYGSYAGAIGQPQFMPSSILHYAVDFDGSGSINLLHDSADVIGSIANFLFVHGWQRDGKTIVRAHIKKTIYPLPKYQRKPNFTVSALAKRSIVPEISLKPGTKASFLSLQGKKEREYYFTLNNFYVITRYNTSPNYAMAVYQLSQHIEKAYWKSLK